MTLVRYADDAILGFQYQNEAERYLAELRMHLLEYGLELNEDKTRLIRFGRFAALNRAERGEGKPESFPFLGLQPICTENRWGRFEVRRITDGDRRRRKLQVWKQEIRKRMHAPIAETGKWLQSVTPRLLPIPCRARQHGCAEPLPTSGGTLLVQDPEPAQSTAAHLGSAGRYLRPLAACSSCGA